MIICLLANLHQRLSIETHPHVKPSCGNAESLGFAHGSCQGKDVYLLESKDVIVTKMLDLSNLSLFVIDPQESPSHIQVQITIKLVGVVSQLVLVNVYFDLVNIVFFRIDDKCIDF